MTTCPFFFAIVRFGDALGVLASEFGWRASAVLAGALGYLIGPVAAVVVVIARPDVVDAASVATRDTARPGKCYSAFNSVQGNFHTLHQHNQDRRRKPTSSVYTLSFACFYIKRSLLIDRN